MMTGAAIYEASRIAATKAKRAASKSQVSRPLNAILRIQRARAANAHSGNESVALDTLGHNAPSTRQRLSVLPLSPLPQTLRRLPPPSQPTTPSLPRRHHPPTPSALPQPLHRPQRPA
nr:unnamed protein product [Spirometra erinaceieuropaei]